MRNFKMDKKALEILYYMIKIFRKWIKMNFNVNKIPLFY